VKIPNRPKRSLFFNSLAPQYASAKALFRRARRVGGFVSQVSAQDTVPRAHAAVERVGAGIGWPPARIASIQPRTASRPSMIASSMVSSCGDAAREVGKLDQVKIVAALVGQRARSTRRRPARRRSWRPRLWGCPAAERRPVAVLQHARQKCGSRMMPAFFLRSSGYGALGYWASARIWDLVTTSLERWSCWRWRWRSASRSRSRAAMSGRAP
jgi:hypothetical protein